VSNPTRVLVDVSQYQRAPATTGIQRVVGELAAEWPPNGVDAAYGFVEGDAYCCGPIAALASTARESFVDGRDADHVRQRLAENADGVTDINLVEAEFDAYLLPEPTFVGASLSVAARLARSTRAAAFFLYYDAFPLTRPQDFTRRADFDGAVTRYYLAVAAADNVAFISERSRRELEARIARRPVPNGIVAAPGGSALPVGPRRPAEQPTFTVVGTLEPRKRHRLVLDAFERLWTSGRDYRLVFVGRAGWESADLFERIRAHVRSGRLDWLAEPTDTALAEALTRSWGLILPSEDEGYGLPVVEALASGVAVVTAGTPPALEGLSPAGQIRLEPFTAEALFDALDVLAEPAENAALRREIHALELPSWARFATAIESWIANTLRERDAA
jgi:glycosyltransferase involved in cell wall biosynthesis